MSCSARNYEPPRLKKKKNPLEICAVWGPSKRLSLSVPALSGRWLRCMPRKGATRLRFTSCEMVSARQSVQQCGRHSTDQHSKDLRDPSTTPLNFTRSINLALSERGINALRHAGQPRLLEDTVAATIPMRGRMIHGKRPSGELTETTQDYDVHGRVSEEHGHYHVSQQLAHPFYPTCHTC